MTHSRTFRVLFVGSLSTTMVVVTVIAAWLLWPRWEEYRAVQMVVVACRDDTEPDPLPAAIENVKRFNGGAAAVEPVLQLIRLDNRDIDWRARNALLGLGPVARQPLIDILADVNQDVRLRTFAAWTLGPLRDKTAIPPLVSALTNEEPKIRAMAAWALAYMAPDSKVAVAFLIDMLEDEYGPARCNAAFALSHLRVHAKGAIPKLIPLLADTERDARHFSAITLGEIGPQAVDAVPPLIECLKDNDLAALAAEALGKIGPEAREAVPFLIELLDNDQLEIRLNALIALEEFGPNAKQAVPKLLELLKDETLGFRASEALKTVDPIAAAQAGIH